jgi:outer membrane protein TolC
LRGWKAPSPSPAPRSARWSTARDSRDFAITEDLSEPLPALREDNDRLLQRAVSSRSELRALRAILSAHERNIGASNRGKLPKLLVGATYDYAKPNPQALNFEDDPPWSDSWRSTAP